MPRNLSNWVHAYLAYTQEQESPEHFHIWVALSCIAGALRRQVYFDMGYFKIYPNMYAVLVAPPGKCKKSTAMDIGREILIQVPGLHFSPDSTSRERLITDLAQSYADGQSAMTGHSSEFASFLSTSGENMVEFLTDIFGCPTEWQHRTKTSGTTKIKQPFFNLLACTTPDDLARKMSINAVGIGLTSRVVFVYGHQPRIRDAIPKLSEDQKALRELLLHDLTTISQIKGEYIFADKEVEKFYNEWYREHLTNPNPTGDPRLAGYYERKHVHWIKASMCVAASMSDETVLTQEHMNLGMAALEMVEPDMQQVFAGVGRNPLQADANAVWVELLSREEGVTEEEIVSRLRYSLRMDEITEVLSVFVKMNKIFFDTKTQKYYPKGAKPNATTDP